MFASGTSLPVNHYANVLFKRFGKHAAETQVTWMSDEKFLPVKTLRPDEQDQLFGLMIEHATRHYNKHHQDVLHKSSLCGVCMFSSGTLSFSHRTRTCMGLG